LRCFDDFKKGRRGFIDAIAIQGHTDERGSSSYNRELSAFSLEKAELMDINNEHYNWFLLFNIITPTLNGEC